MLFSIFRRLFERLIGRQTVTLPKPDMLELNAVADRFAAIAQLREILKTDPANLEALNNLGARLSEIGQLEEAMQLFELAYSLDDTFVPAIVNHANVLMDRYRSIEARPLLEQIKVSYPDYSQVDTNYARMCFSLGELGMARHFKLRSWLANFDNLRDANGHLWHVAYDDEAAIAVEHRFWAETMRPILLDKVDDSDRESIESVHKVPELLAAPKRIKIGYWSPDFFNHSVRYFSRPLIASHDRAKFEIFAYHDFWSHDAHTQHIQNSVDHFHNVFNISDSDLHSLIKSHNLDILVELAGHSSFNRIPLLTHRLATLQLSALGYPPTTGLSSIDAKVVDKYIVTSNDSKQYAEAPLVLANSFWCFDPMEEAIINPEPPVDRNQHVTFGCFTNVCKINTRILQCWKAILTAVPNSRLLIRSSTFRDDASMQATHTRLIAAGIPEDRLDMRKPEGGQAFFESYNEIDIILDTFPFNGGTTTCFATYMGVPVVSLSGESLISRMGLSILSNLGVPELAVDNDADYVGRAVQLAEDPAFLRTFRKEVRGRYERSALGNGKIFAQDFETAVCKMLAQKQTGQLNYQHSIPVLPTNELIRRAYAVMRHGQEDAAQRIIKHCIAHYPGAGAPHLLISQQWIQDHRYEEAAQYLLDRLKDFSPEDQFDARINVCRYLLLAENRAAAVEQLAYINAAELADDFNRMQVQLYQACCSLPLPLPRQTFAQPKPDRKVVHVLVVCDEPERFIRIKAQMESCCVVSGGWAVTYSRCDEGTRRLAYQDALREKGVDILVLMQKNVMVHHPDFFEKIDQALSESDVVSFGGSRVWGLLDWRSEAFSEKATAFFATSTENPDCLEVHLAGVQVGASVGSMAVLDGRLLAVRPNLVCNTPFDANLSGAVTLMEEDWTHSLFKSSHRLLAHRGLGVYIDQSIELDSSNQMQARLAAVDKYKFDPFSLQKEDTMLVTAPVGGVAAALSVMEYLQREDVAS